MNLCHYFLEGKSPDTPALFTLSGTYTYGDLARAACQVSAFLIASGGKKGDRALILAENDFFWVAAYLGTLRAGMIAVPIPATTSACDLASIIGSAEPAFAFVQRRLLLQHGAVLGGIRTVVDIAPNALDSTNVTNIASIFGSQLDCPAADMDPEDLAALMFTSGSTGTPRGVMVSARNIIANTESIILYLNLTANDRILDVLPFHYCFGASLLHTHLRVGGSVVIEPRFMYVEKVLERLVQTECTGFAGVPSHYQILLRKSSIARQAFPKLRYVQQAGGHLAPAFIEQLRAALPNTDIFIMYGQTEATARLTYLPPHKLIAKLGSIGQPIPGVKLSILNDRGQAVETGTTGEIVAEGDSITRGYWRDEHDTRLKFRDGKLYTGDLASMDTDGFIFITERAGDFLKCGGKRVSCRRIEDTLLECDILVEAVVVPTRDDTLGEAPKAFVVPRDRLADSVAEKVRAFCRAHLPLALVPKEVVVTDKLPKNSSGKVLKHLLRDQQPLALARAVSR
jgi:acyl-CoA synthetase (AMP-forming)/AMP-acid ligase II